MAEEVTKWFLRYLLISIFAMLLTITPILLHALAGAWGMVAWFALMFLWLDALASKLPKQGDKDAG